MIKFKEIKTQKDFAKILPVIKQDWGDNDFGGDKQVIKNFAQALKNNYRQFAAYDGNKVVAVTGMSKVFMPTSETPRYDLVAFVVDEAYRNKGVGSSLIDHCKKVVQKDGARYLGTGAYTENYKAQAFYQKNGFKHAANFMFHDLEN